MKKMLFILYTMLFIALPSIHKASAEIPERLSFITPDGIKPKFFQDYNYGNVFVARFVLQGNTIDDWTEAFEVINAMKVNYPKTPKEFVDNMIENRKKACSTVDLSIIDQAADSILYEITSKQCPPFPDEQSLNRVLYGNINVFILIYTNRTPEGITKQSRDSWIGTLSTAMLMPSW
jgi:hypothetical protein